MGKFALIYDDGVHGRHLDSVAKGIKKLNDEGYQTVVVSPTRPEGAKYWAKPSEAEVKKLGSLLKGKVMAEDEVVLYTLRCDDNPYGYQKVFDFEDFFTLLTPSAYRQRKVITYSLCQSGLWRHAVKDDSKRSRWITDKTSAEIPVGIKVIDHGRFADELEEMLVSKELATRKETESPDFYTEGNKGYFYTLLMNRGRDDPTKIIEAVSEISDLIKKYGIETFVQIARETMGSLTSIFYCLKSLRHFVQNKEDLLAKARLISRALPFLEAAERKEGPGDWTIWLDKDFVGKYLEKWVRLMEATQGGVLGVFDSISRVDDFGNWIYRYGWSQFFELAKYAGKDTGKTIAFFLNNIDWKTWNSTPQTRMGTNLWWKWKELIALSVFTKEGTSEALKEMRDHFLSKSEVISPEEILSIAKRGGVYTGTVFKVLPGLMHLVESGLLTREQLIDKIVENAKRCGPKHSAVFTTLAEIAEIIASGEDLDLKTQKILEMTEDAEKPVPLGKFDRAIKKYGITPFAELVKIVAGQRGGVNEAFFELDLKWVEQYGIKPFVEMAKHYGDNPDMPISRWFSAMDHGPASMFEVLVKTYGMEAIVQLFRERAEILRGRDPTLIFSILYRWRETVKSKEDTIRLLDILFKRQVEGLIVPIEFSDLFLELHKEKSKSLDDLEHFYKRAAKNLADIASLLDDYRSVTFEKLTKNSKLYEIALDIARKLEYGANARVYHFPQGWNVEKHLIANLDLKPLIKEATDAEKVAKTLQRLSNLSPELARRYGGQVSVKKEWVEFNFGEINAETLIHASSASAIVAIYEDLFSEVLYPAKAGLWKERKKILIGQFMSAKLGKMPAIKNMEDLTKFYEQIRPLKETIPVVYERFVQGIMSGVDLTAFVRDSTRSGNVDSKMLEEIRQKLNEVHRVLGDEFVLMIGIAMSKEAINKGNFFKKLEEVSACCFRPQFNGDVGKLYAMIGRFQANRLADFLINNKDLFDGDDVDHAIASLEKMGVIVDFEDGVLSKTFRSLRQGQVGYVLKKGWNKLTASDALRDEVLEAQLKEKDPKIPMPKGFSVKWFKDQESKTWAMVIFGKKSEGAGVGYEAGVGTGVDVESFKERIGDSLTALSVGAFTTGERKLADFAAIDGGVVNYLVSDRDGLVLFYPDGTLDVLDIDGLKKSGIATPGYQMKDEPMAFRDKVEDFNIFLQKIKKAKVSVMQGQLLLHNGELRILDGSSGVEDKRRMLAVMEDGSYALIDFGRDVTLLEGAVLAKKMGAKHLVNLDTGMYDFSQFIDAHGKVHQLGTFDSERPTNLIYFYSESVKN